MVDLQRYISSGCTIEWFHFCVYDAMLTSVAASCPSDVWEDSILNTSVFEVIYNNVDINSSYYE